MKAFGFNAHGGLDRLQVLDVPVPEPGLGEVRIAVRTAGLNHLDLFTLEGMPGLDLTFPHIIAGDGTGTIDSVGSGVTGLSKGQKVIIDPSLACGNCEWCLRGEENFCKTYRIVGEHVNGTAAEYVVLPAANTVELPGSLDWDTGAGVALVFMTAWHALKTVGEVKEGTRIAIIGAGGGLVTAAVQVAHLLGARTFVSTRSSEKGERTKKLGADEIIVTSDERPLAKALWEASGKRGFDVIFDSTGRATFGASTRALAKGGRLVFCGGTTGAVVELDLRPMFWRGASIRGSTMATRKEFHEVMSLLGGGKLHPVVDSIFPLAEGRKAMEKLSKGDIFGKVLLKVQ